MTFYNIGEISIVLIHYDSETNDIRFEFHRISSFPQSLSTDYDEWNQKISNFQNIMHVTEQGGKESQEDKKLQHPLLNLDKNKVKVDEIRIALKKEVSFFKNLYAQSTIIQDQNEEKSSHMNASHF